jgi:hypothetical protein
MLRTWTALLCGLGLALTTTLAANLSVTPPDSLGWLHLASDGETNQVHTLEASTSLATWSPAAVLHDGPFDFADVTAPTNTTRYFRLSSRAKTLADDGKNQMRFPDDAFLATPPEFGGFGSQSLRWVKFAILLGDETRVWFQDSVKYDFHFDYSRLRLTPFAGMTRTDFDQRTLFRTNQLAVLGAVLVPGEEAGNEFGIQFVGQDEFTREDILRWFRLVRAAVFAPEGTRALYLPTFEQSAIAQQSRDWFASVGVEVASADRWLSFDAVYSEGWAVGRLTFVPANEIANAYASGQLRPTDILLTDAVPAEVPFVAGIITLTPATPNSHVAILARGFGVPFVWLAEAATRTNLLQLAGREIALRTGNIFTPSRFAEVNNLPAELADLIRQLKLPPPLNYASKQRLGVIATNVQPLKPDMIPFVGGKAANYGLLLRTIPANAEPAIALTFDLWDDFLAQTLPNGRTLSAEINLQLGEFTYPPDFALVRARLAGLVDTIRRTAKFTPAQQAAILGVLTNAGFDVSRKVRFRSSTNVEDSEDFTGAGLYDSYSGCLLDDLDGDTAGPSHCDPEETAERGVFRAIQRVYASFYNENAFLERLRRGVNEAEVGMAVLVHHSFPDVNELANGVATLKWQKSFGTPSVDGDLVTQLGAESVTNPDSSARPEVISFYRSSGSTSLFRQQASSLVPLGDSVMTWEKDYRDLVQLLATVAQGYSAMFPAKTEFSLDFEYKRMVPGRLDVKQVRPLPQPKSGTPIATVLLPEPVTLGVEEGEFGFPLAKHRLKLQLALTTDSRRLNPAGLATPFYRDAVLTYRDGDSWATLSNGVAAWPQASHRVNGEEVEDRWVLGADAARREFILRSAVVGSVTPPAAPWVTPRDFRWFLEVNYASQQTEVTWEGVGKVTNDLVVLRERPVIDATSLPQERTMTSTKSGLKVETRFTWPPYPKGPTAGYTAPNIGFVETRITGLTTEPLVLRDVLAQTYSPGHHNFSETFVFEPHVDPNVTPAQRAELDAAKIRLLVATIGFQDPSFLAISANGVSRVLP